MKNNKIINILLIVFVIFCLILCLVFQDESNISTNSPNQPDYIEQTQKVWYTLETIPEYSERKSICYYR